MKLNLGCGRKPLDGYLNVDRFSGKGVEKIVDASHLPSSWTDSFEEVRADHFFEHVLDFPAAWQEVHRVLKPGGILEVEVPYGPDPNPFHIRHFTERSLDTLLHPDSCLEGDVWYEEVSRSFGPASGFPWWHLHRYTGLTLKRGTMRFRWRKKEDET